MLQAIWIALFALLAQSGTQALEDSTVLVQDSVRFPKVLGRHQPGAKKAKSWLSMPHARGAVRKAVEAMIKMPMTSEVLRIMTNRTNNFEAMEGLRNALNNDVALDSMMYAINELGHMESYKDAMTTRVLETVAKVATVNTVEGLQEQMKSMFKMMSMYTYMMINNIKAVKLRIYRQLSPSLHVLLHDAEPLLGKTLEKDLYDAARTYDLISTTKNEWFCHLLSLALQKSKKRIETYDKVLAEIDAAVGPIPDLIDSSIDLENVKKASDVFLAAVDTSKKIYHSYRDQEYWMTKKSDEVAQRIHCNWMSEQF